MSLVLTTQTVRPNERLSYWVDAVCNTYVHIDCAVATRNRVMSGTIDVQDLDSVLLTIARSYRQKVFRTPEKIARYGSDHFLLQMPGASTCVVEQAGRRAVIQPGDFAIYDCGRTFELDFCDDFEVRFVKIPRCLLQAQVPAVDQLTAMRVGAETGAGALLRAIFDQIYDQGTPIARTLQSGRLLSDALVNIVAAGLMTLQTRQTSGLPRLAGFHLERALRHIRAHLGDPALSPTSISKALALSPSHLQRIFHSRGRSLMEYVWAFRLERCREELVQPRHAHRAIGEIAYAAGFSDLAHFSRAFRKAFGVSPREWRRTGNQEGPASPRFSFSTPITADS